MYIKLGEHNYLLTINPHYFSIIEKLRTVKNKLIFIYNVIDKMCRPNVFYYLTWIVVDTIFQIDS